MIIRYLCVWLCLLAGAASTAPVMPPAGAWRQANVTWKKPPAALKLKERYAEAAVLYFSPDQRFLLLYGTIIQQPKHEGKSVGDACTAYMGTWKLTGNSISVEYRLVSATIVQKGETLPGPIKSEGIHVKGSTLLFQRDRFERDKNLDSQFKAILEDEHACENP